MTRTNTIDVTPTALLRGALSTEMPHRGCRTTYDALELKSWSHALVLSSSRSRGLDPLQGLTPQRIAEHETNGALEWHQLELDRTSRGALVSDVIITDDGTLSYEPALRRERELVRAGERVRRLRTLPRRIAIFDERTVLLDRGPGRDGGHLITDELLVGAVIELFDGLWAAAEEWRPDHAENDPDVRRRVVDLMSQGLVDEAIARRIDVSPRTVARVVAALMREHDCGTRFQLGLALARL